MERNQDVESFISAVAEYENDPTDAMTLVLGHHLAEIVIRRSTIDPTSCLAVRLFDNLYKLMNLASSESTLMLYVLFFLRRVCLYRAGRRALTYNFKFAPILIRLLEINLGEPTRMQVSTVLEILTNQVKLSWSQAQQYYLISVLTQDTMNWTNEFIVRDSLQTLLNVCYKNPSGLSILMRTVDVEMFIQTLLKNRPDDPSTMIQCYHLMVLIENIEPNSFKGGIPEYMTIIGKTVRALKVQEYALLRIIVDFLPAASEIEHSKAIIMNYQNYAADIEPMLLTMTCDVCLADTVNFILKFLLLLVSLKIPSVIPLHPKCVKFAMSCVYFTEDDVASEALALIRAIVIDSRMTPSFTHVRAELNLSDLMLVANCQENDEYNDATEEEREDVQIVLTKLMQLLQEIASVPNLKDKVLESFNEQLMRKLLKPMLEENNLSAASERPEISFNDPATSFCVHGLALTADLAAYDAAWSTLYSEILQKKKIQMFMALALRTGDVEIRQKVLQLISSRYFPQECMFSVFVCLRDLNESTAVKLPTMKPTELVTQARLEATDNHVPNSQHKLVEVVAESRKLQDLLDHNQKCLNDVRSQSQKLSEMLQTALTKIKENSEKEQEIASSLDRISKSQLGNNGTANASVCICEQPMEEKKTSVQQMSRELSDLS